MQGHNRLLGSKSSKAYTQHQHVRPRSSRHRHRLRCELQGSNVQTAQPQLDYPLVDSRQRTREIRARVCSEVLSGGLIYVCSGDVRHRNGADVYHKFRPDSSFAYLTGVQEPGFGCLLDPETQRFTLVAPRPADDAALWWGGLPSLDVMAEEAGADACIYAPDLPAYVRQHHADVDTLHVVEGDHPEQQEQLLSTHLGQHQQLQAQQLAALQQLQDGRSGGGGSGGALAFSTAFLQGVLHRCRAVKTRAEVACLLAASRGSAAAHKAVWRACRPGAFEYQLEAAFVHSCMQQGNMQLGYPCIVGAGRNAAILHYERNSAAVGPDDLVLVDAGAEHSCYTADITRTFPAGGRFSPQQRDVYALVLAMQEAALASLRPGLAWADVQASARALMLDGMQQLGLVARGASVEGLLEAGVDRVFMPHGLGHHLGLDVHDVSDLGPVPQQLQEGHVVTVEPGIYFVPALLKRAKEDPKQAAGVVWPAVERLLDLGGVRIEDNVVITHDGHFNLTMAADMPKAPQEVEEAMAAAAQQLS